MVILHASKASIMWLMLRSANSTKLCLCLPEPGLRDLGALRQQARTRSFPGGAGFLRNFLEGILPRKTFETSHYF